MLVFHRKVNQTVLIDGGIEIKILHIEKGRVKIGITAPDDVGVLRGEVLDRRDGQPDA